MKYETLSESKNASIASGGTVVFTFTYQNNIDSIRCLFFDPGGGVIPYIRLTAYSISNNILTVTFTNNYSSTLNIYLFLLVTVASY